MKIKNTIAYYYNNPKKSLLYSVTCFSLMIILIILCFMFLDFTRDCVDVDSSYTKYDNEGKTEVPITSECTTLGGTTYYNNDEREYSGEPTIIAYLFWSILWIQIIISIILLLLSIIGGIDYLGKKRKADHKKRKTNKMTARARQRENALDYDKAIELYESIGDIANAKRVRMLKTEQGAVKLDQTVVQGDQITKTEIKDSVLNRSNVGGGKSSKAKEIKEIKELLDSGAIDDDEFKQMKKEILGK